jgi:hypothetical protein
VTTTDEDSTGWRYPDAGELAAARQRIAELEAEIKRHRDASLVYAILAEHYDDAIEVINTKDFDHVPWLVAAKMKTRMDALKTENEQLRAALQTNKS